MNRVPRLARPMALGVAIFAAGSLGLPVVNAAQPASRHGARADLSSRSGGHAMFAATGRGRAATFFGTAPGHAAARPAGISPSDSPAAAARGWMQRYGAVFGVGDAAQGLQVVSVAGVRGGASVVRMQQLVSGLPVVGGELSVALDDANNLVSVNGHTTSATVASTHPAVSAASARVAAVRAVSKRNVGVGHLSASKPELSVLDQSILGGPVVTGPITVWRTTVTSADGALRHDVFVTADRGAIALDLNDNPFAARNVCQPSSYNGSSNSEKITDPACPGGLTTIVASDANPPSPSPDADVYNAYTFAGLVDKFYSTLLNRNGINGTGGAINSTVHFCDANDPVAADCPMQNAFWDGKEMVYGDGFASALDVVGHEMTHGVTQHTSNLFSYYQSGAINESESDVMGEMIQQIEGPTVSPSAYNNTKAWLIGENLPASVGVVRNMADPTRDKPADPDRMTSPYYNAYPIYNQSWDAGGVHANDGVGNKAAYLIAAGANGDGTAGTFNGVGGITGVSGDKDMTTNTAGETEDQISRDVKVANIYYTLDKLMVSATTFADLYNLLPQACSSLVGKALPMPSGYNATSVSITNADCAQVKLAVKATAMNVAPTKAGAAVPKAAPMCTNGGSATTKRLDTFETNPFNAGTYKRTHNSALDPYYGGSEAGDWWWSKTKIPYYGNTSASLYQLKGSAASLWGDDADPDLLSPDPNNPTHSYEDARAQMVSPVRAAVGTYVHFNHAWEFDYGPPTSTSSTVYSYDGGVVEYSTNGGGSWHDAGGLFANNGYNGRISNTDGVFNQSGFIYKDPNPLKGRKGFVRSSHGWTSSRLDLSSLAGNKVLLRWRIGSDDSVGSLGWYVDNVYVYSCNPTTTTLAAPSSVVKGGHAALKAHVTRAGTSTALGGMPVQLWARRHGTSTWAKLGAPRLTNKYGSAFWSPAVNAAEDFRVRMIGKTPFAPSNYAGRTVKIS